MLDRETIERIEELHAAVVRAEAEQRFGLLRGKRTRQVAEAEAAEQAFLHEQGFATYNDFRLRIRRSTVADPGSAYAPWEPESGVEARVEDAAPDDPGEHHDPAAMRAAYHHDERPQASEEGSDDMGPTSEPAMSQHSPAVPAFAPDPVAPAVPSFAHDTASTAVASFTPDPTAAPMAPPPMPAFVGRPDEDNTSAADFRRLTEPLFATLQAETDRYITARIDAAEKQAAEIVARASKEGAEILAKASRMQDTVRAVLEDVTRQAEAFMGHSDELAAHLGQARQGVGADLQALRDLAERAQGAGAPAETPAAWASPRVSPQVSAVGSISD